MKLRIPTRSTSGPAYRDFQILAVYVCGKKKNPKPEDHRLFGYYLNQPDEIFFFIPENDHPFLGRYLNASTITNPWKATDQTYRQGNYNYYQVPYDVDLVSAIVAGR